MLFRSRSKIYISSADFMTRNTVRRVEVAAPIYNERIRQRVWGMFETLLSDNVKARKQLPDGTYVRAHNEEPPLDAQRLFFEEAYKKAEKKAAAKEKARARKESKAKSTEKAVKAAVKKKKTAKAPDDKKK